MINVDAVASQHSLHWSPAEDLNELQACRFGLNWASMQKMIKLVINLCWWIVNCTALITSGRDLDFLHAFGGERACHKPALAASLNSVLWDIRYSDADGDILESCGFLQLLALGVWVRP